MVDISKMLKYSSFSDSIYPSIPWVNMMENLQKTITGKQNTLGSL